MSTTFNKDGLIILLGAGASVDAGIPHSKEMIERIEGKIQVTKEWENYGPLYHYLKSACLFAEGIKGKYSEYSFNVEKLINTIDDLLKGDEHPLFPFIGSWAPKLAQLTNGRIQARPGRENTQVSPLSELRDEIVDRLLNEWCHLDNYNAASYFRRLGEFARNDYQFALRVFTLNYDLCVEKACSSLTPFVIERGFEDNNSGWEWRRFDPNADDSTDIYLYKLHGSVDWQKSSDGSIKSSASPSRIPKKEVAIIFGTSYKFQYVDPFLFLAYELRKRTRDTAKLIITIGYGFADEHINGILSQSLIADRTRKLLCVGPGISELSVITALNNNLITNAQIKIDNRPAKDFFESQLTIEVLSKYFESENSPF